MPNACTGKPLEAGPHFLISEGDPVFLGGGRHSGRVLVVSFRRSREWSGALFKASVASDADMGPLERRGFNFKSKVGHATG